VAVGFPKDKSNIDSIVGNLAVDLNRAFRRATQFNTELAAYSDGQLTAAGYTAGEITSLRAFAADVTQLDGIYRGVSILAAVKDFRTSARPMWGILGDY
jgi:hypothetical protein